MSQSPLATQNTAPPSTTPGSPSPWTSDRASTTPAASTTIAESAASSPPSYAPELYAYREIAPTLPSLEAVDDAAVKLYLEQGYLAVERAFDPAAVAAACDGLADLIMGKVPGFEWIEFEARFKDSIAAMPLEQREVAVRKLMYFTPHEPRLKAISHDPRLLAVLERFIGRPPEMFQDMALLKPPLGREKPWHQDNSYFKYALDTRVVGVWIALDEATPANGCMRVLHAGHRAGPHLHFLRRDWQICDTEIFGQKIVAVPLKPGGCLFFDGLLPHGTPHNPTHERRRAVQFHYAPQGASQVTDEQRLAVFGNEGKNVSC